MTAPITTVRGIDIAPLEIKVEDAGQWSISRGPATVYSSFFEEVEAIALRRSCRPRFSVDVLEVTTARAEKPWIVISQTDHGTSIELFPSREEAFRAASLAASDVAADVAARLEWIADQDIELRVTVRRLEEGEYPWSLRVQRKARISLSSFATRDEAMAAAAKEVTA